MSELSKCFYEVTAGRTCRDLCHPEYASCWISFVESVRRLVPGSYKLFMPLLVIPPLLKGGGYSWQYWWDELKSYNDLSFKTYAIGIVGLTLQCVFYKLFGKLHFFWVMAMPGFFSAAFVGLRLSKAHLRLQGITYFNMMLQVVLTKSKLRLVEVLRESKLCGTLLFMIFNARIMDLLQNGNIKHFWMMYPTKIKDAQENSVDTSKILGLITPCDRKVCSHEKSCDAFILDGILKYALTGFIIDYVRAIFSMIPLLYKDSSRFLPAVWRRFSFDLMLFLATYIGSYRLLCCVLSRHSGKESPLNNKIASFLCGMSYMIYPRYQVFTIAFTKFVEMSWQHFFKTTHDLPWWVLKLDQIPYLRIVHMFAVGYMYHTLVFHAHLSPPFNSKAINFCSDNRVERLKRRLLSWMLEHEWNKA
ncbi:uncharacterized protein LOC129761536 [Toxorhynchites rutilus septentrionalis]|uniref:uncharacterized protein LOC129761536 n=1 Tax=Toxorhynchites rutilus septentrionalis TaxID=329112 RepID=UPI0024783B5D|nr:uncharacterized protein LOC129761536 [Toxorhynchites rutilus septentrionalis]